MLAAQLVGPAEELAREQAAAVVHHHDLVKEAGDLEIVPLVGGKRRFEIRERIGPDCGDAEPAFPRSLV
jgi:hypothetical protein